MSLKKNQIKDLHVNKGLQRHQRNKNKIDVFRLKHCLISSRIFLLRVCYKSLLKTSIKVYLELTLRLLGVSKNQKNNNSSVNLILIQRKVLTQY